MHKNKACRPGVSTHAVGPHQDSRPWLYHKDVPIETAAADLGPTVDDPGEERGHGKEPERLFDAPLNQLGVGSGTGLNVWVSGQEVKSPQGGVRGRVGCRDDQVFG